MTETQAPQAPEAPAVRTRTPRKPVPELASLLGGKPLTAEALPPGTPFTRTAGRAAQPRSAEQKQLDAEGKKLYDQWVKDGKPSDFEKCPKLRYAVNPAAVDALVAYLRRVTGTGGPLAGKRMVYRKAPHVSGRTLVTVIFTDKPPKPAKPEK